MHSWEDKEKSIVERLDQYVGMYLGGYYYKKGSCPHVDSNGQNNYNPPCIETIKDDIRELYLNSASDNYYWHFCRVPVYKTTFEKRLAEYKEMYIDGEKSDFIKSEIKIIEAKNFIYHQHLLKDITHRDVFNQIVLSQNKKIEFLNNYNTSDDFKSDERYPIFKDNGQQLFEILITDFVRKGKERVDYSLIYWKMKGKYIYDRVRPSDFLEYLQKRELINERIEQLYSPNHSYADDRLNLYSRSIKGM